MYLRSPPRSHLPVSLRSRSIVARAFVIVEWRSPRTSNSMRPRMCNPAMTRRRSVSDQPTGAPGVTCQGSGSSGDFGSGRDPQGVRLVALAMQLEHPVDQVLHRAALVREGGEVSQVPLAGREVFW